MGLDRKLSSQSPRDDLLNQDCHDSAACVYLRVDTAASEKGAEAVWLARLAIFALEGPSLLPFIWALQSGFPLASSSMPPRSTYRVCAFN